MLDSPGFAYSDAASFVLNSKLFAAGGYDRFYQASAETSMFRNEGVGFTPLPARLNVARGDCFSTVSKGNAYVLGGYNKDFELLHSVEMFDGLKWTLMRRMLVPRGDAAVCAFVHGIKMIVLGGEDSSGASLDTMELSNVKAPGKGFRALKVTMPVTRYRASCVSFSSKSVTLFGGQSFDPRTQDLQVFLARVDELVLK